MQDLKTLSSAVYLDLEWNTLPNAGADLEIIEIGLAELDPVSLAVIREANYLVRPCHVDITLLTTNITGITRSDLVHAMPLREVIAKISGDWPEGATCFTWGNDGDILCRACREHRLGAPFWRFVDLSQQLQGALLLAQPVNVRNAIKALRLPFDGGEHMAVLDARNTARIHAEVVRRIRSCEPPPQQSQKVASSGGPTWFGQLLQSSIVSLPPQNGLLSKAVLMRGEAKNDKVNAGTLHA